MNARMIKKALNVLLFIFLLSFVHASVEVFSDYDTVLKVTSDSTLEISKNLTLKNVYDVGIVPGQIEFKIAKGTEGSIGNIDVDNVRAVDRFGTEIKHQVRTTKDYTVIVLDVYYPLLPGFEYKFNLEYQLLYEPGGIFFKSLQIPLRESTIPIEKGTFTVQLPESYHFTYVDSDSEEGGEINENKATWNIKDNVPNSIIFEYSYLPIQIGSFQGSYVFWVSVNLLLLLFLVYEVRKEIKRIRKHYGE